MSGIEAIRAVFPKRPITLNDPAVKKSALFHVLTCIVLELLCLSIITVSCWAISSSYPGLKRDWIISRDMEPLDPDSVGNINGTCHSQQIVVSCDADVSYTAVNGQSVTQHIEFSSFSLHTGDYQVQAVRSAAHPEMVSLDLAISSFWSRIAVDLFMAGLAAYLCYAGTYGIYKSIQGDRKRRALSGQVLRPVAIRVIKQRTLNKTQFISYTCDTGGVEKKFKAVLQMRQKDSPAQQTPFLLDLESISSRALGVTADGCDYVYLVDEALSRLDLSDAERKAILEAREAAAGNISTASTFGLRV